jgi:D-arabinitol 2-dehydrogenase
MFRTQIQRNGARFLRAAIPARTQAPVISQRPFHISTIRYDADKDSPTLEGAVSEHEGTFARTDESIEIEHPPEHEYPNSDHIQGRGGMHYKRTLASFSMEGKVSVVTGGARGLGLVMGQALVISGADLAIVDLNSRPSRSFGFTTC